MINLPRVVKDDRGYVLMSVLRPPRCRFATMEVLQGSDFRRAAAMARMPRAAALAAESVVMHAMLYRIAARRMDFSSQKDSRPSGVLMTKSTFARFDEVHDIRPAFIHLINGVHLEPRVSQGRRGAARGDDPQSRGQ